MKYLIIKFLKMSLLKFYNTSLEIIPEYDEKLIDVELDNIINDYINKYDNINVEKTCYDLYFGEFTFIKFNRNLNINIFGVFVIPEYRRKGIFKRFIQKIIDKSKRNITMQAVISKDVIRFLTHFRYNNSQFKIINGIYLYKH